MPWLVWVFGYVAMVISPTVGTMHFDGMTYLRQQIGPDANYALALDDNAYIPQTYDPPPRNPSYDEDVDWRSVGKRALSALSRFKPLTSAFLRQRPIEEERRRQARFAMLVARNSGSPQRVKGGPLRYGKR
ncbi:uncharacterized protein LOC106666432 [Cimex lectularius]|uniref:Uncharacterized protein n=1 Tax=Cimex lectularius TaxID=79782 RepID=A0A8I6RPK0_CIMLE|nr:uncharacterized protein LOC106666432 [Cimex lectularius]